MSTFYSGCLNYPGKTGNMTNTCKYLAIDNVVQFKNQYNYFQRHNPPISVGIEYLATYAVKSLGMNPASIIVLEDYRYDHHDSFLVRLQWAPHIVRGEEILFKLEYHQPIIPIVSSTLLISQNVNDLQTMHQRYSAFLPEDTTGNYPDPIKPGELILHDGSVLWYKHNHSMYGEGWRILNLNEGLYDLEVTGAFISRWNLKSDLKTGKWSIYKTDPFGRTYVEWVAAKGNRPYLKKRKARLPSSPPLYPNTIHPDTLDRYHGHFLFCDMNGALIRDGLMLFDAQNERLYDQTDLKPKWIWLHRAIEEGSIYFTNRFGRTYEQEYKKPKLQK